MTRFAWLFAVIAFAAPAASAADPAAPSSEAALTPFLRELILRSMPQPLGESTGNWGKQKEVAVGVKWSRLKPTVMKSVKNDGHWTKVRVDAVDPANSFGFGLQNLQSPAPNTTTFTANITLRVRVVHDQQVWKSGHRLYGSQERATATVTVRLNGEMTTRFETPAGQLLPTAVVRVRVTEADVNTSDIEFEHIVGLNGKPAKAVGNAALATLKAIKPSWESAMMTKANAAIVKSADTKEIRVELGKLFPGGALLGD